MPHEHKGSHMSTRPLRCRTCEAECQYDRCAPFPPGQEDVYAVAWTCPNGHGTSLDVCPVGPLVPARELCLNCGKSYTKPENAVCTSCGLSRTDCPASLLPDNTPSDPVAAASADFANGLFRRGLATVNYALQEGAAVLEAWFLKARFLNGVGFNRSAAQMLDRAVTQFASVEDRVALLEEQSFLWAECQRGEEALSSADAAVGLGSTSLRTHYLRGRALALLGRLVESRAEMTSVLALDPDNADARRALDMIAGALRPKPARRWWQFWR
jgi:tetratricopeptide (TPR) repeat protein